jgi:hypothetical protein
MLVEEEIIIRGNAVFKSRNTISEICSTDTWLKNLQHLNPVLIDIPSNVIAVSVGQDSNIVYHTLVKARPINAIDVSKQERKVLLPNSIFSIAINTSTKTVPRLFWHLVLAPLSHPIGELTIRRNFFPNVGPNNDVCSGSAKIKHDPSLNISQIINQAIDSIIGSPFNTDLLHIESMNQEFINTMITRSADKKSSKAIKGLAALKLKMVALENQDWTKLDKDTIETLKIERQKLQAERTSLNVIIEEAKTTIDWKVGILEFMELWLEENKTLGLEQLSDLMIKTIGAPITGNIANSGVFNYE